MSDRYLRFIATHEAAWELGRLRANGILTDAEFEAKKAELLTRI